MATVNALSVALFNAAAGGYAAEMTANAAGFANAVGPILEKDISTDALFVEHLLGNLGVSSTSAVYSQAKAAVAALVTTKGRAGAASDAIDFLKAQEGTTSAYATIAADFAAKVNKAAVFTAAHATERDVTVLVSAITGVDTDAVAINNAVAAQKAADDAAAAAAAKAAADAAAAAKTAADAAVAKAAADAKAAAEATAKAAADKAAADAAAALKAANDKATADATAAKAAADKAAADAATALKAAQDKAAADLAKVDNTSYASEQAAYDAAKAAAEKAAADAAAATKVVTDAAAAKAAADLAAANLTITTLQNPVGATTTLTTSDDVFVGIKGGNDVVTAAEANIEGDVDVIVDGSSTDSDTINFVATTFSSTLDTAGAVIRGFENINVSFNSLVASTFEADGIGSPSTITVTQARSGGSGDITVSDVADGTTVVAGASVTDLTVDTVAATDNSVIVNGGSATGAIVVTVAQAGQATVTANSASHITVTGDDGNVTINSTSSTEIDETASGGSVVINTPAATDVAATTSGAGTMTITAEGSTGVTYTAKTATVTVTGIDAIVTSTGVGTADTLTVTSTNDVTIANQAGNKVETIKVGGTSQSINSTITTTAATTYYALGAQNVTFKGNSTMFDGKTFVDSSTGTSTVKFTTFATADVSKIASDVIDVNATAAAAATLSANNNANVKLSANINAGGLTIDGDNDSSTVDLSGTLNLTLSSDISGGTLTIDNSGTGDDGFDVVNLTLTAAQTSLDLQADAATVTVTGSKALTLDNTSTAGTFVASGVTAAVSAEVNSTFKKVTTGSGADTLVLNTTSSTAVVDSGSGNDLVQVGVAFAGTVTGGSGSDTLEFTGSVDVSAARISGFEYIDVNANTATIDDDVLNGASIVIDGIGTVQVKNIKSTLDLSALSFASTASTNVDFTQRNDGTLGQNASISITGSAKVDTIVTGNGSNSVTGGAGNDSITGGTGVDTILGEAGNDTIIGSGGADYLDGGDGDDTITGGSVVDTIIAGKGADTVTGGLGADIINLTETVASIDTVILTTGGAIAVDAITGFAAGTGGDIIKIDLSDINALVTDLNLAGNFATAASADAAPTLATVSASYDVGTAATADILVISGDFTASTLETALEVGGSRALTGNGSHSAGDAFLVVYDNGTDTRVSDFLCKRS